MGEVVVCREEREIEEKKEGRSSPVRWERFLAKVSIRVLLVEADDSTRQIIGALLRKCSYKVASVGDGLEAWEVLKAKPHNIDLILCEIELPSVSGYALLTLITEHEICKNIPFIMMSAQDSVSTVYKCMLRGATDFLVKPIRTNELKNLWQHVWRRQSMSGPSGSLRDEGGVQQTLEEATTEINATSDCPSSSKSSSSGQHNCIKKESLERQRRAQNVNPSYLEASNNRDVIDNGSSMAIDLVAPLCDYPRLTSCVSDMAKKFKSSPELDLSLSRFNSNTFACNYEKQTLNHSNAPAFTRYVNKTMCSSDANATPTCNQSTSKQDKNLECIGDRTQLLSPAICNGSSGTGNVSQDAMVPSSSKSGNEQTNADNYDQNLHRLIQREMALTKFRLKRKERCFQKKVLYESRKKLAEQRPRVKGQFVRQFPPDPPPPKSSNSNGQLV